MIFISDISTRTLLIEIERMFSSLFYDYFNCMYMNTVTKIFASLYQLDMLLFLAYIFR